MKKIKKFASKNKMPLASDSDAHLLDEIFASFYKKPTNMKFLLIFIV